MIRRCNHNTFYADIAPDDFGKFNRAFVSLYHLTAGEAWVGMPSRNARCKLDSLNLKASKAGPAPALAKSRPSPAPAATGRAATRLPPRPTPLRAARSRPARPGLFPARHIPLSQRLAAQPGTGQPAEKLGLRYTRSVETKREVLHPCTRNH